MFTKRIHNQHNIHLEILEYKEKKLKVLMEKKRSHN